MDVNLSILKERNKKEKKKHEKGKIKHVIHNFYHMAELLFLFWKKIEILQFVYILCHLFLAFLYQSSYHLFILFYFDKIFPHLFNFCFTLTRILLISFITCLFVYKCLFVTLSYINAKHPFSARDWKWRIYACCITCKPLQLYMFNILLQFVFFPLFIHF